MDCIKGKLVAIDEDEIILKFYASGTPHFQDTIYGKDIAVGCTSLSSLVSEYKDKHIEIWIREK